MTAQTMSPGAGPAAPTRARALVATLAAGVLLGVEPDEQHTRRAGDLDAPTALVRLRPQGSGSPSVVVWLSRGGETPSGCRQVDLATLCREGGLAARPGAERQVVLDAVLEATAETSTPAADRELTVSLPRLREILRERMPRCAISRDGLHGLHIDAFVSLGDDAYYLRGWSHTVQAAAARLTLVSPDGVRVELGHRVAAIPRPDVAEFYGLQTEATTPFGWACTVRLRQPPRGSTGWLVELEDDDGDGVEASCPPLVENRDAVLDLLLGDLTVGRPYSDQLRADHLSPALTVHLAQRRGGLFVRADDSWGAIPASPDVSVIVPLYGRIDFVEHQLAQFVHDQEMVDVELIYVLDSPEQAEALEALAGRLHRLYGMPFRTITLSTNAGYSEANNIGAASARGRLLLLLNSDVIPDRSGWLRQLVERYDAIEGIGAMGPKLLYEDGSLQHAGIVFERPTGSRLWNNEHRFKGLQRHLPAANVAYAVPAVTGACLLIDAGLYEQLGGFRGCYVQGDFEDSDLCLRLWELGRSVWYEPSVELFHLESQSYPSALRRRNGEYNRWLHTHLWDAQIMALLDRLGS